MAIKYLEKNKYIRRMRKQVLLLNLDQTPINVINLNKAYKLIIKNKVYMDETDNDCYEVQLVSSKIKIPKILILKYYVKLPYRKAAPSRKNIFKRDKYTCQYCGIDLCDKTATVDHITPKSKGGSTSWTNLVTACKDCNLYKGNRTPKEAKMELKSKPKEPSHGFIFEEILIRFRKK